ncbi:hypothetical protein BpHYR1_004714 [Brachionus plicatilis]|uniref:Uncharacterized protein n=1 Tax=Brachionus plicatilis TaxID=10195 RepID=A0A3M7S5Y1_BRAPC|nr:hypothetical protein BpHYR1_004714 [Brachionus plicatilis]
MDKSLEKLSELKKQEDLLKKLISNLESQKQRLEIEELNLVNIIEKESNLDQNINHPKSIVTYEQSAYVDVDLNLDPLSKQKFQQDQIEEEEEEEE